MKKYLSTVFCFLLAVSVFSSCGEKKSVSEISSAVTAIESVTEAGFTYDGTFNEEVFEYAIKNMRINDSIVSMPCAFGDLGDQFTLDEENPFVYGDCVTYKMQYDGTNAGSILYKSRAEKLSKLELKTTPIDFLEFNVSSIDSHKISAIVAGAELGGTIESIEKNLGKPTSSNIGEENHGYYNYSIDDDNYISFFIDNGEILSIDISYQN